LSPNVVEKKKEKFKRKNLNLCEFYFAIYLVKGRDNDLSGEIEVGIFGGNSKA
jgi:hypothetical protein